MRQQQLHQWPQLPGWPQLPVKIPWLVAQPHVPAQIWLPGQPPPPPGTPYWRLDVGMGAVRWFYEVHPVTQVNHLGQSPASRSARAWVMLYGNQAAAPARPFGLTRDDDEWIARHWALTEDAHRTPATKRGRDAGWLTAVLLGGIVFCILAAWISQMHGFADHGQEPRYGRSESGVSSRHPRGMPGEDFPAGHRRFR